MYLTVITFYWSGAVTCEKRRKLALAIIEDFCACVKPLEQELERGIIHGDFNEQVFEAKMEIQVLSKHDVLIDLFSEYSCGEERWSGLDVLSIVPRSWILLCHWIHTSLVKIETKLIREKYSKCILCYSDSDIPRGGWSLGTLYCRLSVVDLDP